MTKKRVSKPPDQRRAELIAAARMLFDEHGVESVRVSDIVARVGVAQGTFYYHFQSKEAAVEAVVEEVVLELECKIAGLFASETSDFSAKLRGLVELYLELIDQFTADDALTLPSAGGAVGHGTPMSRARERLMASIIELVEDGAQAGDIRCPNPGWTARVLEAGLLSTAETALPSRQMLYTLIENSFCMLPGSLC